MNDLTQFQTFPGANDPERKGLLNKLLEKKKMPFYPMKE